MNIKRIEEVQKYIIHHIDIKQFTENYIESIINKDNSKQIKDYLEILNKLQKIKNAYLSSHLSKHIG